MLFRQLLSSSAVFQFTIMMESSMRVSIRLTIHLHELRSVLDFVEPVVAALQLGPKKGNIVQGIHREPAQKIRIVLPSGRTDPGRHTPTISRLMKRIA